MNTVERLRIWWLCRKGHEWGWPPEWDAGQRRWAEKYELNTQRVCDRCGQSWMTNFKGLFK